MKKVFADFVYPGMAGVYMADAEGGIGFADLGMSEKVNYTAFTPSRVVIRKDGIIESVVVPGSSFVAPYPLSSP